MELRTLKYFAAVAEHGTVVAAADHVLITQPALSRQVQQLEKELGVVLFDRRGGRLMLSSAGAALLPMVLEVLSGVDEVRRAARVRAVGHLESIVIAAPATTLTDVVAPFITTLTANDPTPSVRALEDVTRDHALAERADLFIAASPLGRLFTTTRVAQLPVFAYVTRDHPWAAQTSVTLEDLARQPLITLPRHFAASRALDAATLDAGRPLISSEVEASNGTIAQALAASGRGVALVTDDARFDLHPLLITTQPAGSRVDIHLFANWTSDHPAASVIAKVAHRLASWVGHRYPSR